MAIRDASPHAGAGGGIVRRSEGEAGRGAREARAGRGRAGGGSRAGGRRRRGTASQLVRGGEGQATVEFAIAVPILIVVAVIAVNALVLFSECASFDRLFCTSVRVHAASPAYGQGANEACGQIEEDLRRSFDEENVAVSVSSSGGQTGYVTFEGTLSYRPTLFGMGMATEVFGVGISPFEHTTRYTVSVYRPGVLL